MSYLVNYYNREQFPLLKEEWRKLEKGVDMTYYQSYDWYQMLNEYYVPEDTHNYSSVYAVLKKEDRIIMIAPFWIVKHTFKWVNKKGIYLLGHEGWTDYVNFIYVDFDSEGLTYLLNEVSRKFGLNLFRFVKMKRDAQSYNDIIVRKDVTQNWTATCVALILPSSADDYKKMLSKNSRQNIRTAYNRLKRDGIEIRIEFDDQHVNRDVCRDIREQRFIDKFQKMSKLRYYKNKLLYRLRFRFGDYLPFYSYGKGHFLTLYHGEELCSFFYYLRDDLHQQILVQAAGVNMNYTKYSPGMLSLNAFINHLIENKEINIIDFTIGDELYKFAVGGVEHFIGCLTMHL